MTALLTADWCQYGKDSYMRKTEVYSMDWLNEVDLDTSILTPAPFGGPIAVRRDRSKLAEVKFSGKPIVTVYTASGRKLETFLWNNGNIVETGWSCSDELLFIQEDGCVLTYDMFGNYQHTFSMGQEAQELSVIEGKIFSTFYGSDSITGVAVLTKAYRIFVVSNVKEPKVRRLPVIPGPNVRPNAWAVICKDRQILVLVARGQELYLLNPSEPQAIQQKYLNIDSMNIGTMRISVLNIAVSQDYSCVAMQTDMGQIWIGSSDLDKNYRIYDTRASHPSKQLVWCGTFAVLGVWDSKVTVIGKLDHSLNLNFPYDWPVHLVQEVDCVRVVSTFSTDIIQQVPLVVQEIFRVDSTSPGSNLFEASKQFQKQSHRADDYIQQVKPDLQLAITQCIQAAGHEFNPVHQKMLITAASFGKVFSADYNPEKYVEMCRILRVLNAVRDPKIGIPLTYTQLKEYLTVPTLLDKLIARRQYYLAIQAAKYLRLSGKEDGSHILAHWAFYKVKQTSVDRDTIAEEIASKLGNNPGVSYTEIAKKAADYGRTQLTIKLLDYEPRASLQVPLLLRLGQDRTALQKAISSGNTDLVYTVLLHLRDNMSSLRELQMEIRKFPLAQALYLKYCKEHNKDALRDIYLQEDDHLEQAACHIRDVYNPKNDLAKQVVLVSAQEAYKRGKNDLNAALCDEQLRLLNHQKSLEENFKRGFVNLSLHDTIKTLLEIGEVKLADKLRSEYKVPDKRYWWLRIMTLAANDQWRDLENFSKSKKPPIGFEPFVDVCLERGKPEEAQKYFSRIKEENKVKYYIKLGMHEEAAKLAFAQRDRESLRFIQAKADKSVAVKIAPLLAALEEKK
nr:PREDICTED: vacuolar protein sorting-associated protein 16 homolog [Bemisia tabaci]